MAPRRWPRSREGLSYFFRKCDAHAPAAPTSARACHTFSCKCDAHAPAAPQASRARFTRVGRSGRVAPRLRNKCEMLSLERGHPCGAIGNRVIPERWHPCLECAMGWHNSILNQTREYFQLLGSVFLVGIAPKWLAKENRSARIASQLLHVSFQEAQSALADTKGTRPYADEGSPQWGQKVHGQNIQRSFEALQRIRPWSELAFLSRASAWAADLFERVGICSKTPSGPCLDGTQFPKTTRFSSRMSTSLHP